MKNSSDTIGKRTSDLPACNAVPGLKSILTNNEVINKINTLFITYLRKVVRSSILLRFRGVTVGPSRQNLAILLRIFLVFIQIKCDILHFFVYAV